MKATYIDYNDTLSFSSLLINYFENNEQLAPFYGNRPDEAGFSKQINNKTFRHRKTLVNSLLAQQGNCQTSEESLANIHLLSEPNSYTITTGHQLNIFTGPLYFIFKIATAIKLSLDLKEQFPSSNFIPVYWMATEDHDFEEINNTHIFRHTIKWNKQATGATGRLSTSDIKEAVQTYQRILGLSANSNKLSEIIEQAYLGQSNLADATRSLANQLFGNYGLVIIDADQVELKQLFIPVIKKDILEQNSSREVEKTSKQLTEAGFKTQVHGRDINFFYLKDNYRERIILNKDGKYEVLNQQRHFSENELLKEIETHPERFSPNVIMRPVYQEVILPNLAYIGGGAEINYWMQLKSVFDYYQIDFPILIPRNSAMIADGKLGEKIYRLNFTYKSIFKNTEVLKKEYVRVHSKHRLNLNDEWLEFTSIFEKIKLRAYKIDPTLGPSTDAIEARLKKAIDRLEKKLIKADQNNYKEALNQIERIKDKLFPGGILQERIENFGPYYVKYGDNFIQELVDKFKPLEFKFTILY
jgi:bacillithiol biosynthesis cysteine-adding enzyme BshC